MGKVRQKLVKCDNCGETQIDESKWREPHRHSMLVLSVPTTDGDREYLDFCCATCLLVWAHGVEAEQKEKQ